MKRLEDFAKLSKPWEFEGVEWREVKLGDKNISEIIMGQSPPSSSYNKHGEGIPFLQGNKEFGKFNPTHVMFTTDPKKKAQKGDVLISVRAPVGDVNIADQEYCIGRGLAAIRFNGEPKYLFYLFVAIKEKLEELGKRGSTFRAITQKHLKNLKIPIPFRNGKPDLETQKKIVEYIEANFSKIDKILEKKKKELEKLDELWESVLEQAFKPKEGVEWREVRLGEVAKEIKSGGTPSRKNKEYWDNGTIPWVKIQDIPEEGYVNDTEEKITEKGLNNSSAKLLPKGTILFTIFATIGRVGILNIEAATNQAIAGVIPKENYDRKYLYWVLYKFGEELRQKGRGGAQNNVNLTFLKKLKVLIPFRNNQPDLEKQREIANYLDSVYEKIKILKEKIQNQITQLEEMKESILDEVFDQ